VSASSSPGGKGGASDVRGNPLFSNTGGEKRKIRPPASDPTATPPEPVTLGEEARPELEEQSRSSGTSHVTQRRPPPPREMGEVRFDEFYVKKTMHFVPLLLDQFEALARRQHKSKTRLFNEAIAGVLASYGALDEETRAVLREFGLEV